MSKQSVQAELVLANRARVELRLPPEKAGAFSTWLVVELPVPRSPQRHEGRHLADPRLPESEIVLVWGKEGQTLSVTAAGKTWQLVQDTEHADRWKLHNWE